MRDRKKKINIIQVIKGLRASKIYTSVVVHTLYNVCASVCCTQKENLLLLLFALVFLRYFIIAIVVYLLFFSKRLFSRVCRIPQNEKRTFTVGEYSLHGYCVCPFAVRVLLSRNEDFIVFACSKN